MTDVSIILFDGFEPLDMAGPVEVFGDIGEWRLRYFSEHGGPVSCRVLLRCFAACFGPAGTSRHTD